MARDRPEPPASDIYLRFKASFLLQHPKGDKKFWPVVDKFVNYARRFTSGSFERHLQGVKVGEPAPKWFFEMLVQYRREMRRDTRHCLEEVTEPALAPFHDAEGLWGGWERIADRAARPYQDKTAMYLSDPPGQLPQAAESFAANLGYFENAQLTHAEAIQRGERVRGMSVDELTALYTRWYEADFHTVMLAVNSSPQREQVVSMAVCVPVTAELFGQLCNGRMRSEDIPNDRIVPGSGYVWVDALAPFGPGFQVPVADRSDAETHTVTYQIAYFTNGMKPFRPAIATVAPGPLYLNRLERLGFRSTGHTMIGTPYPIMALTRPRLSQVGIGAFAVLMPRYLIMSGILRKYQRANRRLWSSE